MKAALRNIGIGLALILMYFGWGILSVLNSNGMGLCGTFGFLDKAFLPGC